MSAQHRRQSLCAQTGVLRERSAKGRIDHNTLGYRPAADVLRLGRLNRRNARPSRVCAILQGAPESACMAETRKIAAILAADVVLATADLLRPMRTGRRRGCGRCAATSSTRPSPCIAAASSS
jgi:hypothetical protein